MVGMRIADVQEDIDHELISKEEISDIINRAAARASEDYRGKNPLLVCVLKGAVNTLVIGLSLLHSAHPEAFQRLLVRTSIPCYRDFILAKCRSLGFASTPTDCAPCSGSLSLRLRVS